MNNREMLAEYIKTLTDKPITAENHQHMMRCAEHIANKSDQPEKVGVVLISQNFVQVSIRRESQWLGTGHYSAKHDFNRAPTDDSHSHHAEFFISKMSLDIVKGATLYVTRRPCARCTAMLLPLGLKAIYYRDPQPEMDHLQALRDAGVHIDGGWIKARQPLPLPLESVQQSWADRWPKKLDQSVFVGAPTWAKWAFVTAKGDAWVVEGEPHPDSDTGTFRIAFFVFPPRRKYVGAGYDSTNWQDSLIAKAEVTA